MSVTERGRSPGRSGRSAARPAALVLVTWTAAALFVLWFAAVSSVGPVVMRLTHRHGVHAGDLLALAVAVAAAAFITGRIVTGHRRS